MSNFDFFYNLPQQSQAPPQSNNSSSNLFDLLSPTTPASTQNNNFNFPAQPVVQNESKPSGASLFDLLGGAPSQNLSFDQNPPTQHNKGTSSSLEVGSSSEFDIFTRPQNNFPNASTGNNTTFSSSVAPSFSNSAFPTTPITANTFQQPLTNNSADIFTFPPVQSNPQPIIPPVVSTSVTGVKLNPGPQPSAQSSAKPVIQPPIQSPQNKISLGGLILEATNTVPSIPLTSSASFQKNSPIDSEFSKQPPSSNITQKSEINKSSFESEEIFEELYEVTEKLENKLKKSEVYKETEGEIQQLKILMKKLETCLSKQKETAFKQEQANFPTRSNRMSSSSLINKESYTTNDLEKIIKIQRFLKRKKSLKNNKVVDFHSVVKEYQKNLDDDGKQRLQYHRIMKELIDTEKNYVRKLRISMKVFVEPLETQLIQSEATDGMPNHIPCKLITRKEFDLIFFNIRILSNIHENFLKSLQKSYASWPTRLFRIYEKFDEFQKYLKYYSDFISNYPNHIEVLTHCRKSNKLFRNWLRNLEHKSNIQEFDISDVTIAPIERIQKYQLLVGELAQLNFSGYNTMENGNSLQAYLNVGKQFIDKLSDKIQLSENLKALYKLDTNIKFTNYPAFQLINRTRYLVKQGEIMKLTDKIHYRKLYLFNDLILLTKRIWKAVKNQEIIDEIIHLHPSISVMDDVSIKNSFRLVYLKAVTATSASNPSNKRATSAFSSISSSFSSLLSIAPTVAEDSPLISGAQQEEAVITFITEKDEERVLWMKDITNTVAIHSSQSPTSQSPSSSFDAQTVDSILLLNKLPSKKGVMQKMEGSFIKFWKPRWIQISSGILYSFLSEFNPLPLRSYNLSEFQIKQLYVTDNFTRYCIHLVQINGGRRQIILSTYPKDDFEEWLSIIKIHMNWRNPNYKPAHVTVSINKLETLSSMEDLPSPSPSSPRSSADEKNVNKASKIYHQIFPEEVTNEFLGVVNDRYAIIEDDSNTVITLPQVEPSFSPAPTSPSLAPSNDPFSSFTTTPSQALGKQSLNQVSGFDFSTWSTSTPQTQQGEIYTENINPFPHAQQSMSSSHLGGDQKQVPQALLQFQAKFNLPPEERPFQFYTLASGCCIFLTKNYVCVESLFSKNQAVTYNDISALHKSKAGLLGNSTGGRIELRNGNMIELSGILKRRECFDEIQSRALSLGYTIGIYREGYREA